MYTVRQDKRNGFYAVWDSSEKGWQDMEPISEYFLTAHEAIERVVQLLTEES